MPSPPTGSLPPHTAADAPEAFRVEAGTGPDALVRADLAVALPPGHPAGHGSLRLRLDVSGDTIVNADPVVGMVHRGAEKLFEARDYRQILTLANRHDWLAGFAGELGVALVVEEALGLEVPERAVWIRMALAEVSRIAHHLAFLAAFPTEVGEPIAAHPAPERELLSRLVQEATGGRMHPMYIRLGGLRADLPMGWVARARHTVAAVRAGLERIVGPLRDERLRGVGPLPAAVALGYGVSGPTARASGIEVDLRRDATYLRYAELFTDVGPGRVVTRPEGDVAARLACLAEEVEVSCALVEACLDRLDPGPVNVRLPKVVRVPEGSWYTATESPLGAAGVLLVSRGEPRPWRLALRTPSFAHVAVLAELLAGAPLSDLAAVLASVCFVLGDVDK